MAVYTASPHLFLAGSRRPVVRTALELVRQVVDLEARRIVVRVDVALPPSELAPVPASVAQRVRWTHVAVLAHVGGRLLERDVARIRLRRAREVDRRLREVEPRLGKSDMLDCMCGCDRDEQCPRIGVADVL